MFFFIILRSSSNFKYNYRDTCSSSSFSLNFVSDVIYIQTILLYITVKFNIKTGILTLNKTGLRIKLKFYITNFFFIFKQKYVYNRRFVTVIQRITVCRYEIHIFQWAASNDDVY